VNAHWVKCDKQRNKWKLHARRSGLSDSAIHRQELDMLVETSTAVLHHLRSREVDAPNHSELRPIWIHEVKRAEKWKTLIAEHEGKRRAAGAAKAARVNQAIAAGYKAVAENDALALDRVLNAGLDSTKECRGHKFPIIHTAAKSGSTECVAVCLRHGAHVQTRVQTRNKGSTPLHFAASENQTGVMSYLLEHGCPPDVKNERGQTPLMVAASFGHAAAHDMLIRAGASTRERDAKGLNAADHAELSGQFHLAVPERPMTSGVDGREYGGGRMHAGVAARDGHRRHTGGGAGGGRFGLDPAERGYFNPIHGRRHSGMGGAGGAGGRPRAMVRRSRKPRCVACGADMFYRFTSDTTGMDIYECTECDNQCSA